MGGGRCVIFSKLCGIELQIPLSLVQPKLSKGSRDYLVEFVAVFQVFSDESAL